MSETEPTPNYTKGQLNLVNPNYLLSDSDQPRKFIDPDAQKHLAESIQTHGILQPILFRIDDEGKLFIVAGERRVQAAKKVGLETIPAIYVEGNHNEIALVENLLRQDLTAIEVAEALDQIMKEHGYKQEQLTGIIGRAKSTVSEILSLNRLPDEIRDECRTDPYIPRKVLIEIAKKKRSKGMLSAYKKYKERSSSPPRTSGPKGKRKTWQERFTVKYENLTSLVTGMDFGTLDEPSRTDLISRIEELKKTADSLIAQIQSAPVKEPSVPEKAEKKKPVTKPAPKKVPKKKTSIGGKTETEK